MRPFSSGPTAFFAPSPIWWQILHFAKTFSPSAGSPAAWARLVAATSSTAPAKSPAIRPINIDASPATFHLAGSAVSSSPIALYVPITWPAMAAGEMVAHRMRFRGQLARRVRPFCTAAAGVALLCGLLAGQARAADRLRIAVQRTGTLAWEMSVIRAQGLDKEADLDLQSVDVASVDAAIIALRSGAVDIIVTDWLWVSRERSLGANFVFYPYSSAIGAVVANPAKGVTNLRDLIGRKLAVAGGPLDKSWLLLQAWARRTGLDLRRATNVVYGAPPLLAEKAAQGEVDAALEY